MNLLDKINDCDITELNDLIRNELEIKNRDSEKNKTLGFGIYDKLISSHKGFINFNNRIKYATATIETYSMQTVDYFYEFAHAVKENKIANKDQLVVLLQLFINSYFGINKSNEDLRSHVFNDVAWQTTETDEEYFEKLENNEIGDLKGKRIAMCTERGAIAQNLLALFDFETYYCIGCVLNNNIEEAHCFNVAATRNGYALLDYSMPCTVFSGDEIVSCLPFQGIINKEEIQNFLNGDLEKKFPMYCWIKTEEGYKKKATGETRSYVVGKFKFNKDTKIAK